MCPKRKQQQQKTSKGSCDSKHINVFLCACITQIRYVECCVHAILLENFFFPKEKFGNFSVENEKKNAKFEILKWKIENFILKIYNFLTLNNVFTIIVKME